MLGDNSQVCLLVSQTKERLNSGQNLVGHFGFSALAGQGIQIFFSCLKFDFTVTASQR